MPRARSRCLLLLLCLPWAMGCGPVSERQVEAESQVRAVVGGEEAPGEGAVVALVARRTRCTGEPLTLLCSGALVAPDVVLTAAHCLSIFGPEGAYEVFLGARLLPEPEPGGRFVRVSRAAIHPRYERATHAWDVALLRLAEPVEVAPVGLPEAGWGRLEVGQAVRVVGFGDTRRESEPSGVRRMGWMVVEEVREESFRAGPGPSMSCVGDSGGPVLAVGEGGREVVVGVTVSGDLACRKEAQQVRVEAAWEGFIKPFLEQPPGEPGRVLAAGALCRAECARDEECPSGLSCVSVEGEPGRCLLHSLQAGDYGAACTQDGECGEAGVCARLEPAGEGACRCFTPCREPQGWGCRGMPGAGLLGMLAWLRWLVARSPRASCLAPARRCPR